MNLCKSESQIKFKIGLDFNYKNMIVEIILYLLNLRDI